MLTNKFGMKFVPHAVTAGSRQSFSHGRQRGVAFCHINNQQRFHVVMPEDRTVRVRFVKSGLMYANMVVKSTPPAWANRARAAARGEVPRAPAPISMKQMVVNLTAIEQANRARALHATQSGR